MRNIAASCIVYVLLTAPSCNFLIEDGVGTGTMSVVVNGSYHELSNVTGTEYMGFFCGGDLSGKRLSLALGQHPQAGDTLDMNGENYSTYPVYCMFAGKRNLPGNGAIVIMKRKGSVVTGMFYFDTVADGDTVRFRNGYFSIEFEPSR